MTLVLLFIAGALVGVALGMLLAALCVMSKREGRDDDDHTAY